MHFDNTSKLDRSIDSVPCPNWEHLLVLFGWKRPRGWGNFWSGVEAGRARG
jgi:hypothetical protein